MYTSVQRIQSGARGGLGKGASDQRAVDPGLFVKEPEEVFGHDEFCFGAVQIRHGQMRTDERRRLNDRSRFCRGRDASDGAGDDDSCASALEREQDRHPSAN
ncbi:hypothetical protein HZA85_03205 [Candidatus Uhrbacteria bacterium]|nr:hypothetical protein [Candidatus Uhrbacteria bacterium]